MHACITRATACIYNSATSRQLGSGCRGTVGGAHPPGDELPGGLLQALARSTSVRAHEAPRAELGAAEVPHDKHGNALEALAVDRGEDRAAGGAGGLAVVVEVVVRADAEGGAVVGGAGVGACGDGGAGLRRGGDRPRVREELAPLGLELGFVGPREGPDSAATCGC